MTACSKIGMGGADALAPAGARASETTMLSTAGVRHRKFFFLLKKKKKVHQIPELKWKKKKKNVSSHWLGTFREWSLQMGSLGSNKLTHHFCISVIIHLRGS